MRRDSYADPVGGQVEHPLHTEGRCSRALYGAPPERRRLEERLGQIAPRLLGVTGLNDQVIPPGDVLNLLQGFLRLGCALISFNFVKRFC